MYTIVYKIHTIIIFLSYTFNIIRQQVHENGLITLHVAYDNFNTRYKLYNYVTLIKFTLEQNNTQTISHRCAVILYCI